jgi:hypothetical protein
MRDIPTTPADDSSKRVRGAPPSEGEEVDRLKRLEREIRSRIDAFAASDKLLREDLHRR